MTKVERSWQQYLDDAVSEALGYALDKLLDPHDSQPQSVAEVLRKQNLDLTQAATTVKPDQAWRCIHTLSGYSYGIGSIALSPDGQTLASGSFDNTIKLWHLSTGKLTSVRVRQRQAEPHLKLKKVSWADDNRRLNHRPG